MKFILLIVLMLSGVASAAEKSVLREVDERLTNLELYQSINQIQFDLQLNNYFGIFKVKDRRPAQVASDYSGVDEDQRTRMNSQVRLSANANISNELFIYSQFESNFQANSEFNTNNTPSSNTTFQRRGTGVFVRRAYFDYHFSDHFSFSMGRLPTTNGPPQNVRNNLSRSGTYPLGSFSIPLDGVAITSGYQMGENNQLILRTIYVPGGLRADDEDQTYTSYQVMSSATASKLARDHEGITQMLEVRNNSGLWEKALFIAQASLFSFGAFKDAYFDNIDTQSGLAAGRYRISSDRATLSTLKVFSSYFQFDRPFYLPLTFYLSHSYTKLDRKGSLQVASASSPYTTLQSYGFLSDENVSGNRWITGINFHPSDDYFFGLEYMDTSKFSVPTSSYTDELTSFVDENGTDYHLYCGRPFMNARSVMRIGVHQFKRNQAIVNNKFTDAYEDVFAAYLLFNMRI